jgi:hypothetical protein
MKKTLGALVVVFCFLHSPVTHAQSFKNCTAVNKVYPWGVSKTLAAAKKQKNYPVNNPLVSASIYASISKMDRDKDLTACEK